LYEDTSFLLEDEGVNRIVKLVTNSGAFYVHTDIHAVKLRNGYVRVYSFDSFINHSCEPNSTAIHESASSTTGEEGRGGKEEEAAEEEGTFLTVATRDILSGEEVTTDYDTFIYHYEGIPRCQCGSTRCRGHSFGFQRVPPPLQPPLLPRLHPAVLAAWLRNTPRARLCPLPLPHCQGLRFVPRPGREGGALDVVATRGFQAGEVVWACPLIAVDPALTDSVLFMFDNPWVCTGNSGNIFAPLAGFDMPVMKLDISIATTAPSDHSPAYVCSVLDALAAERAAEEPPPDALHSPPTHTTSTSTTTSSTSTSNGSNCAHRLQQCRDPQQQVAVLVATTDIRPGQTLSFENRESSAPLVSIA
jgi:hypothetical protein